ncbi:EAL domain-containing protein [Pseudomonas sp. B2M1-30]|uniref:EAL domain-containing protein n=1 Tax=Pseudomonas TaxID=286 RepID=UPI001C3E6BB1|nr:MULTISPECIES: EAL domain-containing protein [Pseudomonas]MBV4473597.1 EAL domain-containing protein [Pseudomonas botevensis]MCU0117737.1 EAL domain-containing protein [Pseudomonas sp. B2M1-30]MCU7259273.1 EAL domain-containing protein [Pseudomonas koreensis]
MELFSYTETSSDLKFCSVSSEDAREFVNWFYQELAQGHFFLAFQPIIAVGSDRFFYYEGLLRHCNGPMKFSPFAILEGQKSIRDLDHCVVSSVIAMLREHPAIRLGCNISAQSAVVDEQWKSIISQLKAEPQLAERLVIEITESASPDQSAAADFVIHMRSVGCLLAVDDFGSGFSTLEFIRVASPDIIKIDKGYLLRASNCATAAKAFEHLVGLCKTFVPYVIAEGVEFEADTERLANCAVEWMQGFFTGRPERCLPGITGQCVVGNYL